MHRRTFLKTATYSGAALAAASSPLATSLAAPKHQFHLKYAPHPGTFKFSAPGGVLDEIKFAADQGFTALEYNRLAEEAPDMQEKIGNTLADLGMTMGVFVAYASFDQPTFAVKNEDTWTAILDQIRASIDIAKRVNAKWFTVVPGSIDQQFNTAEKWNKFGGPRLAHGYQTANVIELLRRCAEILEPHDLVMVLEPLNPYANHGGLFLQGSPQAYALCTAVDSPSCKILFDIYHQQITEGNLIPNIDHCWDQIGYFQAGDNPGRKEPGTGEINYRNVFKHIYDRSKADNREFIIGMEHGNSIKGVEGEKALIAAYVEADSFDTGS
ncbi:MAG: TIM barrel protein [Verrucomicrobiota bacterium]